MVVEDFKKDISNFLKERKENTDKPAVASVLCAVRDTHHGWISEEKFDTNDYLDLCFIWYRDVLLYKACGTSGGQCPVIFKEELTDLASAARYYSYEAIERIIRAIDRARSRIAANVNFDLTMELMFLDMKAG